MSVSVWRTRCEREGAMWRTWVCACACALVVALGARDVRADQDSDKRAEMSAAPFVMGSRYGRSPPRLLAPRNDRFFMGSRYGKRAELESSDGAALRPPQLATLQGAGWAGQGGPALAPAPLACRYTGLPALYRCRRVPPALYPAPDYRRFEEESNVTEEE